MKPVDPRELLDHLLSGGDLEAQYIDQLLARLTSEGLHLEYKGWDFIDGKDATAKVRRYVAGFANSDGGVLLIGFHENRNADGDLLTVSLDGKPASPRAKDGAEWLSRALTLIAPMLSPAAHIKATVHQEKPVLAIAVARAPNIVWCAEERRMAYYLRLGDQTLPAPEYLHADIVTGRRARPVFEVVDVTASPERARSGATHRRRLRITLSNAGLVWVDEGIIGLLCYGVEIDQWAPARPVMLAHVEDGGCAQDWSEPATLVSQREQLAPFVPLTQREQGFTVEFPIPTASAASYRWRGVLYVLPKNCPPTFWQLELVGRWGTDIEAKPTCRKLQDGEAGVVSLARGTPAVADQGR